MKVIAIDIDGILTVKDEISAKEYDKMTTLDLEKKYRQCVPNKEAIKNCNKFYQHNTVFLYTCRDYRFFDITVQWLNENNVAYHSLIMNKPYYDIIFDDKAVNVL